jgi:alpha-ribazole phosphatase
MQTGSTEPVKTEPVKVLAVAHGGVIRELRRRFERVAFWDSTVNQAEGRRWQLRYQPTQVTDQTDRAIDQAKGAGEWQCSYSSAPPARP